MSDLIAKAIAKKNKDDIVNINTQLSDKANKNTTYINALDMPKGFPNFVRNDNTKDNSAALQYLFDHITDSDGDFIVHFPIGNYYFSTNVVKRCKRNVILSGTQGRTDYASTTRIIFKGTGAFIDIKCSNPANDNCNFDDSSTWNANLYNGVGSLKLQNIWLATDSTSAYKTGTYGIRDWRGGDIILEDSTLQGWDIGFWAIESDFNSFKRVTLRDNRLGMFLGCRTDQNLLQEMYTYTNDTAIEFNGCQGANVQACYFVENDVKGVAPLKVDCLYGDTEVTFDGCWFEDTSTAGGYDGFISIGENSNTSKSLVVIIDNPAMHLIGRHAYFVRLDYGTGITFSNVRLRNNLKLLHTMGSGTNSPFISLVNVSSTVAGTVDSNIVNSGTAPKISALTNNFGVPTLYSNTQNRVDFQLGSSNTQFQSNYGFTGLNINHNSFASLFLQFRKRIFYGTSAPTGTSVTYAQGDICFNQSPTAGSYVGWVCVAGGAAGTWKGFGLIES
ncbi:hypothetical protein [Priestia aryabhattai]|uniref:hypothetical protein n=1 Tax=Priestia aryabhattai TaxID=412384 RepID=UPI0015F3D9B2|nr:hypothetical protein [Priestia aryabhattai]